jgi:integrase
MRTKQLISYPTLNDKNGDPTKDWYVEYSFRLPGDDQLHRYRICGGLRRTVPTDQRYTVAAEIIRDRTEYLKTGVYLDHPDDTSPLRKDDTHRPEHQRFTERSEQYRLPYIIDRYMQDMKGTIRLGSFRKYQGEMNVFLDWIKAENQPLFIGMYTQERLQSFFDYLAREESEGGRGLCYGSIKQYRQRLSGLFAYAKKMGVFGDANPADDIRNRGKLVDCAPSPFTKDERTRLKEAILPRQPYLWLAIELLYYSAIRPGEARLLKVGDIDRERRLVNIRNSVAKNKRTQQVGLNKDTLSLMERLGVFAYHPDLYLFGRGGIPSDKPIGKSTLRTRFSEYRRQLHIPADRTLYAWKHTGAINALEKGMDLVKLKDHMRHANIDTTMQYAKKRGRDVHAADGYIDQL